MKNLSSNTIGCPRSIRMRNGHALRNWRMAHTKNSWRNNISRFRMYGCPYRAYNFYWISFRGWSICRNSIMCISVLYKSLIKEPLI